MAAQLYQWVVLEVTWARYEHDKNEMSKQHVQSLEIVDGVDGGERGRAASENVQRVMESLEDGEVKVRKSCAASVLDYAVVVLNRVQDFVKNYSYGQLIGTLLCSL